MTDTARKRTGGATAEVAALLAVQHPNLVRLLDVVADGDGAELVLARASGGSLHDLLALRRRLTAGEAVTIGVAVATALAELHRRGLVHGDVHPGNILFDHREGDALTPLLADLGSTAPIGHVASGHGAAGCTAPEVERGAPPSPASDQWSLAAALSAALGPVVTTPLAVVLRVALAPEPSDRFPSIDAMATALRHAAPAALVRPAPRAGAQPRSAPPVTRRYGPAPPPAPRRARRRGARRPSGTVIAALAVIAATAALSWSQARAAAPSASRRATAVVPVGGEVLVRIDGRDHRYRVGEPGDAVLLGDWSCEGRTSVGLYRPSTGRVLEFGAAGGAPIATAQLAPGGTPVVRRTPQGCDAIAVRS